MESEVSEILENVLSLLALEGSFEVDEKSDVVNVSIDLEDAGKLIGRDGETLGALQYLVNMIVAKNITENKRVIVDVASWRQSKEEELANKAKSWVNEVLESGSPMELPPMPSWQRRIVHLTVEEAAGVKSESVGEGPDRHLVISAE
jgi:spoIIIJ-associated protein